MLYLDKKLCKTFFSPKVLKYMKHMTYNVEVFKTFKSDFKAMASSIDEVGECYMFKDKMLFL